MSIRGILRGAAAIALTGALALGATLPASATTPKGGPSGTKSLAEVLAADGSGFDSNWNDFDILDNAVTAVLKAKPGSKVAVLADGKVALTAFLPTDAAFRQLVKDLTGTAPATEEATFAAIAAIDPKLDLVETVLLYHVVPGKTITYWQALGANGAKLTTAQGGTITVKRKYFFFIKLVDADPKVPDPYIVKPDINKGNLQIGHAINRVLLPVAL